MLAKLPVVAATIGRSHAPCMTLRTVLVRFVSQLKRNAANATPKMPTPRKFNPETDLDSVVRPDKRRTLTRPAPAPLGSSGAALLNHVQRNVRQQCRRFESLGATKAFWCSEEGRKQRKKYWAMQKMVQQFDMIDNPERYRKPATKKIEDHDIVNCQGRLVGRQHEEEEEED